MTSLGGIRLVKKGWTIPVILPPPSGISLPLHGEVMAVHADVPLYDEKTRDIVALLEQSFAQSSVGVCYFDSRRVIRWANPVFAAQIGAALDQLMGQSGDAVMPGWTEQTGQFYDQVRETGEGWHATAFPYVFPDQPKRGTTYWDSSITPVLGPEGAFDGWLLTLSEVTELVQVAQRAEQLTRALREVNKGLAAQALAAEEVADRERALREELQSQSEEIQSQSEEIQAQNQELRGANEALLQAQRDLAASEKLYRTVGELIPFGVWVCDPDGGLTYLSDSFLDLVGKTLEECKQFGWMDRLPPEDVERTIRDWTHHVTTGELWDYEHRIRGADGQYRTILSRGVPLRDAQGNITSWAGINLDITEKVIARQKSERDAARVRDLNARLVAEDLRLRAIIDQMPEGIVIADREGRVTMTNPAADRLYARPVPYGQHYTSHASLQICHPDGRLADPRDLPLTRSALDGEVCSDVELLIRWPDGQERPLLANSAPIRDDQGQITGAVGVFQDITPLKELDRLKDEFLSIAAHELKSPMTSIKGFAQLLMRRAGQMPDGGEWVKPLRTIDNQVSRLADLVNRLLDVSRIQLRRLELVLAPLDLVALVHEVAEEAQMSTSRHEIAVQSSSPSLVGQWDRNRVDQVLANLLSNAIQYSPQGGRIEVAVAQQDGEAIVSVRDQGVGIPAEIQSRLFERYYRAADATRSRAEGMGLGLYVAHGIVAAHGGRIWVESEPGRGSTFYFTLPIEPAASA